MNHNEISLRDRERPVSWLTLILSVGSTDSKRMNNSQPKESMPLRILSLQDYESIRLIHNLTTFIFSLSRATERKDKRKLLGLVNRRLVDQS
jgi:hypothetical protein